MGEFHTGLDGVVFPDFLAGPVEFFNDAGLSAEGNKSGRRHRVTEQVACLGIEHGEEAAVFAFPFLNDVAGHVDEIGGLRLLRSDEGIALHSLLFAGENTEGAVESLISLSSGNKGNGTQKYSGHGAKQFIHIFPLYR